MAKDAKGHGSDARGEAGGVQKPVPGFIGRAAGYELAHRPGLYEHLGMTDQQSAQVISDKNAADALANGHPKADVVATHPAMASSDGTIARWQSPGGKWAAELRAERGGYHLSSLKNGNPVGASWRPDIKDDASAIAHFDNHVRQAFDVKMKRVK